MTANGSDPRPDFVYVTYIAVPREKVWEALVTDSFTEQYFFGTRIRSEWRVGGPLQLLGPNGDVTDQGTLLEYDPPHRLTYTWTNAADTYERAKPSQVTFKLDTFGQTTRLTLTHSHLIAADVRPEADSPRGLNNGWPMIVSSLKSLLETGRVPAIMSEQAIDKAREGG